MTSPRTSVFADSAKLNTWTIIAEDRIAEDRTPSDENPRTFLTSTRKAASKMPKWWHSPDARAAPLGKRVHRVFCFTEPELERRMS
jgi:hypothetical protein